jgi:hypothetical protein
MLQHQALIKLRQQNESLSQQEERLASVQADNVRLSNLIAKARTTSEPTTNNLEELMKLRGEVGILRRQTNDLEALLAENQRLKSTLSRRATSDADVMVAPKVSWGFQGYADPESAFQSAFWAMNQGDATALLNSLAPGGRESTKVQSSSEVEYLKKRKQQFDEVTAFKIIDKEVVSADEAILTVFLDGAKQADRFRLQRFGNDWKLDGPYRENRNATPIQ